MQTTIFQKKLISKVYVGQVSHEMADMYVFTKSITVSYSYGLQMDR